MKNDFVIITGMILFFFATGCNQNTGSDKKSETGNNQQSKPDEKMVVIHTDYGDMKLKLYNKTPLHRDNFLKLVKEGWYDGSTFHRVIEEFMIQGGKNSKGKEGPGYRIDAEFVPGYIHKTGALAAARQSDQVNPQKKSSGSQFYIVQGRKLSDQELDYLAKRMNKTFSDKQREVYKTIGGTPHLDGDYTVFGELVEGFDVLDKIAAVKTIKPGDKPVEDVSMTIEIIE